MTSVDPRTDTGGAAAAASAAPGEVRRWRAFALLAAAYFMTAVDLTIVNVALPTIGRRLHFAESDLQWVVTAYALTFGGFLLLGGRAADLLGRRRTFMAGLALFTAASLACALAPTGTFLIVMRGVQGLGSALVLPAALLTAVTGAFTALFYWYYRPFLEDGQVSSMLPLSFALLGVAFAAWTLFSFSLAAFLGAVFKRIVPAMAVTLVVYIALALATATAIRPHYETPVTVTGWNGASGTGWVTSSWLDSPSGQPVSENEQISLLNQLPASALTPPKGNPKKKPPADSRLKSSDSRQSAVPGS